MTHVAASTGATYWLASYPKSGNTWCRAFITALRGDPVNINALEASTIGSSRAWLDEALGIDTADLTADEVDELRPSAYAWTAGISDVAYRKVHDACLATASGRSMFDGPDTRGALYIIRNPLDVAPSYASHRQSSLDAAIAVMGDSNHAIAYKPGSGHTQVRQRLLSWSQHVESWVDAPGLRVQVVRYEDLSADPVSTFGLVAQFLELASDPMHVATAVHACRFEVLAAQEAQHGFREAPLGAPAFFRQGRPGAWRNVLSQAQVDRIVADHGAVMRRFGYLDADGRPL